MDAPALRPFRRSGKSTNLNPFLWVESRQNRIIYSYVIQETFTTRIWLVNHEAACGLGALLAALRHHHGPDDTAGIKAPQEWKQWKRSDMGIRTAEERSEAIQYLEKQLGQLGKPSGSWEEALSLRIPEREEQAGTSRLRGEQAEESRRGRAENSITFNSIDARASGGRPCKFCTK